MTTQTSPFYSTTRQAKIDALGLLRGQTINVQDTLDDISDGAGGCERMSYGTHDGKVGWLTVLTVLTEDQGRTYYAWIVIDDYKPFGIVERVTWGSAPLWWSDQANDSAKRYADLVEMFDDDSDDTDDAEEI